jgi:hypothetical protein
MFRSAFLYLQFVFVKFDAKANHRMLMKLSVYVNFTSILQADFSFEHVLRSFHMKFVFVIFCQNEIGAKVAHEILMKLSVGVNFTNNLQAAFSFEYVF